MSNNYGAPGKYRNIEMVSFSFKWLPADGSPETAPMIENCTCDIQSLPEKGEITGFCNFEIKRLGMKFENYEVDASYFYFISTNKKLDDSGKKKIEISNARDLIWPKFYDSVKSILGQAGFDNVSILSFPKEIGYEVTGPLDEKQRAGGE